MGVLVDETGNRYGRLLVLRRNGTRRRRKAMWLCKCDCGKETTVVGYSLRSGKTKSCGCLGRNGGRLPEGESAFNILLISTRSNAERRGHAWELSREQVRVLSKQNCFYCGVEPRQIVRCYSSEYTYNGIDRMNNDLGYTEGNCVPCCKWCNRSKNTRSAEDFVAHAARVTRYQTKRKGT